MTCSPSEIHQRLPLESTMADPLRGWTLGGTGVLPIVMTVPSGDGGNGLTDVAVPQPSKPVPVLAHQRPCAVACCHITPSTYASASTFAVPLSTVNVWSGSFGFLISVTWPFVMPQILPEASTMTAPLTTTLSFGEAGNWVILAVLSNVY